MKIYYFVLLFFSGNKGVINIQKQIIKVKIEFSGVCRFY